MCVVGQTLYSHSASLYPGLYSYINIFRYLEPAVTLDIRFSVADGEKLEERRKEREGREGMWRQVLLREEKELQREIRQYEDILLVDVVDVYRNLPKKLLKFYSW